MIKILSENNTVVYNINIQ